MNILVSCMGYDSGKSGISAYMRNVVERLKNSEHDITLVIEGGSEADFDGFKSIVVPKMLSKSAAFPHLRSVKITAAFHGTIQRYLIGILNITANGNAVGKTGNIDPRGL